MTTPTQLPVPSEKPQDLKFNAGKIDEFVASMGWTYTDRFGNKHYTIEGIRYIAEQGFSAQLLSQQQRFDLFIQNSGYKVVGEYTAGPLTLTEYNQLIRYQSELWKLTAATDIPFTTTGNDAASWANDSAHFSSVGDAALRQELAALGGSGLVGYSYSDTYFAVRSVADELKHTLKFDDFAGTTDDERWASMVAYMSTDIVTSIAVEFASRTYSFTVDPGLLTKPFVFIGKGGRNTLLKFTGCNGIRADLITYNSRQTQSRISHLSLIADSQNTKTAFYFKGATGAGVHAPALILDGVDFMGLRDLYPTGNDADEWAVAVSLEAVAEVHLKDVYICGSRLNATYAGKTTSKGIFANTVNGLRIGRGIVYTTGSTGIEMTGNCEGAIFDAMTMVGMDIGISFHDLRNPSNNHVITGTHISAYTKGIEFRKNTDPGAHPVAVFINNCFILEREGNASKPDYTALDCYVNSSVISGVTIQSNAQTSPVRRAMRVSNQSNTISNIYCYLQTTALEIDAIGTDQVFYSCIHGKGIGTLLAGAIQYATGAGFNEFTAAPEYDIRASVFRVKDIADKSMYEVSGNRHLIGGSRQSTNQLFDFRTVIGGAAAYDGRILFSGGSASVDGQANAFIYAATTRFGGTISGMTANTFTCGTSTLPWAGGFTQTAFTVTSDERSKANLTPFVITSDERRMEIPYDDKEELNTLLDAWEEVGFFMYQFVDRIEEKGEDKARWHFGVVAQRVIDALTKHGLKWDKYAFICYDEWEAAQEVLAVIPAISDEDGNVLEPERVDIIQAARIAGNKYGIRYEEALILEAALQRRNYQRLLSRIEALEGRDK